MRILFFERGKLWSHGLPDGIHKRLPENLKYSADIAVVVNTYPDVLKKYPSLYRRQAIDILLRPLLDKGMKIDFYGRNWGKMKPIQGKSIPKDWIKGPIEYKHANKVYSSAKINIGLQNYMQMVRILKKRGILKTNIST